MQLKKSGPLTELHKKLERFFAPELKLYWRGYHGKGRARYYADKIDQWQLLQQFIAEAGLKCCHSVAGKDLDALLAVAGNHGYSLCTIGGPVEKARKRASRA